MIALRSIASSAQGVADAKLKAQFQEFDANQSGWLSGREITACGCRAYDTNGDGEITWEEYRAGALKTGGAASQPAGPRAAAATATAAATAAKSTYEIPDRVEVNYDGKWYPGNIYAVQDGKYKVMRDNYTSDDRWFTAANLRPLAYAARTLPAPTTALPATVPTGSYLCTTVAAGFSSTNSVRTTIGTMRVVGAGSYTGVAKSGTGPSGTFTYDAPTGRVEWDGGSLKGFFGKVAESRLGLDSDGVPYFDIVYRVRDGGNLFNLSCRREGA